MYFVIQGNLHHKWLTVSRRFPNKLLFLQKYIFFFYLKKIRTEINMEHMGSANIHPIERKESFQIHEIFTKNCQPLSHEIQSWVYLPIPRH